jgi:outer membrane protein assembly complex protein YaeT
MLNPFSRPRFLGKDVLAQDLFSILQLYRQEGFPFARILDAAVVYEDPPTHLSIEVTVDEGKLVRIRRLDVEGVSDPLRERVQSKIRLQPGQPLKTKVLAEDEQGILGIYAEEGMITAEALGRIRYLPDSLFADVVLQVREGPVVTVRDIHVVNPEELRTRASVIRRLMALKEGDVLLRKDLLESQSLLYRTGLFRSVRIVPEVDTTHVLDEKSVAPADVMVRVSEKAPGWYGAGGGFSSNDELRLVAEWGHRNLWGRWRVLQTEAGLKYSLDRTLGDEALVLGEVSGRINFTEPLLFGTRLFSHSEVYYNFEREITFEQNIAGFIQSFRRELRKRWTGRLGFEFRFVNTTDPASLRENYQTHLTSVILGQDLRDSFFDPTRGHNYRFVVDYAGGFLGEKNQFLRTTAGASWYIPLRRESVAAFRIRAGLITPLGEPIAGVVVDSVQVARVPFEDRYRTGGGTTVRGYKEQSLGRRIDGQPVGGLVLFVGNMEIRFPLFWRFQGAFFMDAGNIWADPSEWKLKRYAEGLQNGPYSPLAVAYSLGAGLRLKTPVGPLRLDYGRKVGRDADAESADEIHLSLGQPF